MSDIKLFRIAKGQASDLEKPLQTLIENNLERRNKGCTALFNWPFPDWLREEILLLLNWLLSVAIGLCRCCKNILTFRPES